MSDFVIHKGLRTSGSFARHYGAGTREIHFSSTYRTKVVLDDGRAGLGSCLGCGHAPCMEKQTSELSLAGALEVYPGDPSLEVCPSRAIEWDKKSAAAVVIQDACIGCGLCISRCPYGAINLHDGTVAKVQTDDPDRLISLDASQRDHSSPILSGPIGKLDALAAAALPVTVGGLSDSKAALFIRNLLNEIGLNARVRRRGDTNMRIDAVGYSRSERPFVAEIELSGAVLESPRALLEDVAILHARYGYAVSDIDPISVILSFPNIRSEYYQVIRDIDKILGLKVRTITVGALIALLWSHKKIEAFSDDTFLLGEGLADLSASLNIDDSDLIEPYSGAFKPAK